MLYGVTDEAIAVCNDRDSVAGDVGERVIEGHARNSLGTVLAAVGRVEEGIAQLRAGARHRARAARVGRRRERLRQRGGRSQSIGKEEEALAISIEGAEARAYARCERACGVFLRLNTAESNTRSAAGTRWTSNCEKSKRPNP